MAKRIVYIIGGYWGGSGMERVLIMKANYMADVAGYEVHILLTEDGEGPSFFPVSDKIDVHNVHINFDCLNTYPLRKKIGAYYQKQKLYKKRLTDFLIQLKPDITVSAMRREINFLNQIPDGSKKVGEIHFGRPGYREVKMSFLPAVLNRWISRLWMNQLIREIRKLSCFIVLSQEDKANWTELEDVKVIHNPLPFFPEESSTCENKKVIAVGRYTYQKGFDMLATIWTEVNKKYPDWELHLYGGGDAKAYQQLAKELNIEHTFICHPAVKDIDEKLRESSVFAFSSRFEGFGMAITEAMACGLPVVSFACPCGPKDIIHEGEDGFLIPPDDLTLFADRLCQLISNEGLRQTMGRKARCNAESFKMEHIGKQWEQLFSTL